MPFVLEVRQDCTLRGGGTGEGTWADEHSPCQQLVAPRKLWNRNNGIQATGVASYTVSILGKLSTKLALMVRFTPIS